MALKGRPGHLRFLRHAIQRGDVIRSRHWGYGKYTWRVLRAPNLVGVL